MPNQHFWGDIIIFWWYFTLMKLCNFSNTQQIIKNCWVKKNAKNTHTSAKHKIQKLKIPYKHKKNNVLPPRSTANAHKTAADCSRAVPS